MPDPKTDVAAAFNQIVREWNLIPAMPTAAMYDAAEQRMLRIARFSFGDDAVEQAWDHFQRNKGWKT